MRVSLCMIVKNEERFLPDFIRLHQGFIDDWVIVDTGSTDRTLDIIRKAGLPVYSFEWCNDFAAARNYALSLCTGEWIAAFDADEMLDPAGQMQLRYAMQHQPADAFSVRIKNYVVEDADFAKHPERLTGYNPPDGSYSAVFASDEDYGYVDTQLVRFFRRDAGFCWNSPVHEVLVCDGEPRTAFLKGVNLHHLGSLNLEGKREKKQDLYRQISRDMHRDLSTEDDPKVIFEAARFVESSLEKINLLVRAHELAPRDIYILKEMANSYLLKGETDAALNCCKKMIDSEPDNLEAYLALAHCYWMMKQPSEGVQVLRDQYAQFRRHAMYHYTLATLTLQCGEFKAAQSYAKRAYKLAPKSRCISDLHARIDAAAHKS